MWKRLVVLLCAVSLALMGCANAQPEPKEETASTQKEATEPKGDETKKLNDYSWSELGRISAEISDAGNEDEARAIAQKYHLVNDDGTLTQDRKQIMLKENRLDVRLAGIFHDERSDGGGKAGLTFMTVGAIDKRSYNADESIEGGWEKCDLRAWLQKDALEMFEPDLVKALVAVEKRTNNTGIITSADDITTTSDKLWPFSVREICGDVSWDAEEYRGRWGSSFEIDQVLNAEGEQYEVFSEAGVNDHEANAILSLEESTGAIPWWYRSVFPFEWTGYNDSDATGYVCKVTKEGFPEWHDFPQVSAGVVIGFCV